MRADLLARGIALALLGAGALGCDRAAERAPVEAAPPAAHEAPTGEPFSGAWILAHAAPYLEDDSARRAAMEASLTNPANLYSKTRLGAYGRGRTGWDALPIWNPRTRRIDRSAADALARGERVEVGDAPPLWSGSRPTTMGEWIALGERVFFELPLRSEPFWEIALHDPERGEALGVERDLDGSVPGLVLMRDTDGRSAVGITCALCHTARDASGAMIAGRARRRLDYGRIRLAYYEERGAPIDPLSRARWESWGPGRADVLEDVADIPIAIPDLWGLRHQRLLTQAGTLRHESPLALAIRQETQYTQANHHQTRPPRELMFALVMYLYALEPPPARPFEGTQREREAGALVFANACGRCHSSVIGSGALVPIEEIGTHAELANGSARGTGGYRPSPLVRVVDAAPYLHHGAVATLEELLSPERVEPGHRFGMDLSEEDRDALLGYLRSR